MLDLQPTDAGESFVTVGVLARIAIDDAVMVRERLDALPGVETFDVDDPNGAEACVEAVSDVEVESGFAVDHERRASGRLGLVIEADGLDAAHSCLCDQVNRTEGVLGTWPIAVELADGTEIAAPDFGQHNSARTMDTPAMTVSAPLDDENRETTLSNSETNNE